MRGTLSFDQLDRYTAVQKGEARSVLTNWFWLLSMTRVTKLFFLFVLQKKKAPTFFRAPEHSNVFKHWDSTCQEESVALPWFVCIAL